MGRFLSVLPLLVLCAITSVTIANDLGVHSGEHPIPQLHQAALDGDLDRIRDLLQTNKRLARDINAPDRYVGVPVLYPAAKNGHVHVVRYLVEEVGANVNQRTTDGSTALHVAAFGGELPTVRELLRLGAAVNIPNDNGFTPLDAAEYAGHDAIVDVLRAHQEATRSSDNNAHALRREKDVELLT
jgi:ankyrin repeat protein